jgi:dUTPase
VLGRVIGSDYHGEIRLLVHNGGKKDYVWNVGSFRASLAAAVSCD